MKLIIFIEKYGFLVILLYCLGVSSPDFTSNVNLMDLDLSVRQDAQAGSNTIKKILWTSMFIFFVTRIFFGTFYSNFKKELIFCLGTGIAICLISFLSTSWSLYPDITLKRAVFQVMFFSAVALSFMFSLKHQTFAKSVELSIIIVIGLCLITIVTNSGFNSSYAFAGYTPNKNVLASNLLILIVLQTLSQKLFFEGNSKSNILFYSVLFLLLLTQSKTSIALVFLYLLSINTLHRYSKPLATFLFVCCIAFFVFFPCILYYSSNPWHLGLYIDEDVFTGRGLIWENIYYDMFFFSKVEFGYGYGSYFGVDQIPYFFDEKYSFLQFINSAHNGYIGLFIQLGFIGCIYLFSLLFWLGKQFNHPLLTYALLVLILHNVTESSFYRDQHILWFLFVVLVSSVSFIRYGKVKGIQ